MPGPVLLDSEIGPLLGDKKGDKGLGYKYISGYGPSAIWEITGKTATKEQPKGTRLTQERIANYEFGSRSPYYVAPAPESNEVLGSMRWNPQTGKFDIPIASAPGQSFGSTNRETALLPDGSGATGYVTFGPNGPEYATNPDGSYVVAADAPREPVWHGFAPPSPQYGTYKEEVTGDQVFTRDDQEVRRVPGANWAALSPQQKQDQALQIQRQADDAAMARQAAGDVAAGGRTAAQETGANQRAGLSAAASAFGDVTRLAPQLGQLALDNAGFTRDVLKTAPDYLARAFFQQGQASPLPQVSQADIINQLRSNISGFNSTLQGFRPRVEADVPPPVAPPVAASPPAPVVGLSGGGASYIGGGDPEKERIAREAFAPGGAFGFTAADAPKFAGGGFTREPMFMVGDSRTGMPTGHEEIVTNPQRAPIAVRPMNGYAGGTGGMGADGMHRMPGGDMMADSAMPKDPEMMANDAKVKAMSKLMGFVENPNTLHAMVDEMSDARSKMKPKMKPEMPAYANGTGLFGFDIPQLPMPGVANQTDIQSLERRVRPPALNDLFAGRTPNEPRFGFNIFTPMGLNALTPDDRAALPTTLATQFNETLPNVEAAIADRWSTGNRRRAALVGF